MHPKMVPMAVGGTSDTMHTLYAMYTALCSTTILSLYATESLCAHIAHPRTPHEIPDTRWIRRWDLASKHLMCRSRDVSKMVPCIHTPTQHPASVC